MLYSEEEYIKVLLDDNKLHDAEVIGLKFEKSCLQIDISCKGMNPSYYFKKIDDVIMSIKIYDVTKLDFDYSDSSILINELEIRNNDGKVHITINNNDLDVVGDKVLISCKEIKEKEYDESNRKLDNFLKND